MKKKDDERQIESIKHALMFVYYYGRTNNFKPDAETELKIQKAAEIVMIIMRGK